MKTAVREGAQKAAYAVMGAPVVAGRKIAQLGGRVGKTAQRELEAWVTEGEKLTERLMDRKVVTDIKERVDLDQLQGRVEKLRDQLEDVLASWRDNFKPQTEDAQDAKTEPASKPTDAKAPAEKATAEKTTAEKTNAKTRAKRTTPKTTAKTAATKKTTAKKTAAKTGTTKKTTTKTGTTKKTG